MTTKKEICKHFRSYCRCRQILLFFQVLIILSGFIGTCFLGKDLSYEVKPHFFVSTWLMVGILACAFEILRCRNCPFFRAKMAHYRATGIVLILRIQYRLIYCFLAI
jgi:hypothetical protein